MTGNIDSTQSVRHYFARLSLHGQSRATTAQWQRLSVETFFVAMQLPRSFINPTRKECGVEVAPLGSLFAGIRWS